jgi:hypothetical protein
MQQLPEYQQLIFFVAFCCFAALPIGIAIYEWRYNKKIKKHQ